MKYFAYGSNMDKKDLEEWCKKKEKQVIVLEKISTGTLKNYSLQFNHYSITRQHGVANIMKSSGDNVYGLIFQIDETQHALIKEKEGFPLAYKEITVTISSNNEDYECITYKLVEEKEKKTHQKPSKSYLELILNNARENDFPNEYIDYVNGFEYLP